MPLLFTLLLILFLTDIALLFIYLIKKNKAALYACIIIFIILIAFVLPQMVQTNLIMTFGGILIMLIILASIAILIFWLTMLIDAIKNQKEDKFMWVFLIVFFHVFGAILYYFMEKNKRAKV